MAALLASRRRDAVVLALDLATAKDEKMAAQQEAERERNIASTRKDTILAQQKIIADLQAIVRGTQVD